MLIDSLVIFLCFACIHEIGGMRLVRRREPTDSWSEYPHYHPLQVCGPACVHVKRQRTSVCSAKKIVFLTNVFESRSSVACLLIIDFCDGVFQYMIQRLDGSEGAIDTPWPLVCSKSSGQGLVVR